MKFWRLRDNDRKRQAAAEVSTPTLRSDDRRDVDPYAPAPVVEYIECIASDVSPDNHQKDYAKEASLSNTLTRKRSMPVIRSRLSRLALSPSIPQEAMGGGRPRSSSQAAPSTVFPLSKPRKSTRPGTASSQPTQSSDGFANRWTSTGLRNLSRPRTAETSAFGTPGGYNTARFGRTTSKVACPDSIRAQTPQVGILGDAKFPWHRETRVQKLGVEILRIAKRLGPPPTGFDSDAFEERVDLIKSLVDSFEDVKPADLILSRVEKGTSMMIINLLEEGQTTQPVIEQLRLPLAFAVARQQCNISPLHSQYGLFSKGRDGEPVFYPGISGPIHSLRDVSAASEQNSKGPESDAPSELLRTLTLLPSNSNPSLSPASRLQGRLRPSRMPSTDSFADQSDGSRGESPAQYEGQDRTRAAQAPTAASGGAILSPVTSLSRETTSSSLLQRRKQGSRSRLASHPSLDCALEEAHNRDDSLTASSSPSTPSWASGGLSQISEIPCTSSSSPSSASFSTMANYVLSNPATMSPPTADHLYSFSLPAGPHRHDLHQRLLLNEKDAPITI